MMKTIIASTCSMLLLCFCGCESGKTHGTDLQVHDAAELIRQIAIQKFDEVNGVDSHQEYDITVQERVDDWIVFFEKKTKLVGHHSAVQINKETGEVQYFKGQ